MTLPVQFLRRMKEIGVNSCGKEPMPADVFFDMISGAKLMVVTKGPKLCPDCGKPIVVVHLYPKTEKPLSELFPGS